MLQQGGILRARHTQTSDMYTQGRDNHRDVIVCLGLWIIWLWAYRTWNECVCKRECVHWCVCVCVSRGEASICTFVITVRKCLFMFDWVGPVGTLGTFKQTISTSCLKSLLGGAEKKKIVRGGAFLSYARPNPETPSK
ncbi:hypothetical protein CRENBAI_016819 [Crenichthys baileyi]|uniref:Uncharacterized protein n=1 Tax=Crenichthys baileyi TaxID=28760 RepID=A0AAV9REX2_9TELE